MTAAQMRGQPPHHKMVGWYEPRQLIRTAGSVFVSTLFGRFSDHRLIEALSPHTEGFADFSARDEIVVDYVSDAGDGWDSTYAVAYWLTRPQLSIGNSSTHAPQLRRGDVLVFGGDQVYPTPSRLAYKERLVEPYRAAMANTHSPHPRVFAIPGNHDWYDSLASFTRLFCSGLGSPTKWFAGWKTVQTRSYFAMKLPGRWWLVGLDVQLASNIDEPQVAYFRELADKHMQPEDRVIVCTAEPHWIYTKWWGDLDPEYTENNARFVEDKLFSGKVRVSLAGDLHHYRRHATADGKQRITAGGGGAFLHPTHGADTRVLDGGFTYQDAFPTPEVSKRLTWRNLAFLALNPKFGSATAAGYLMVSWTLMTLVREDELGTANRLGMLFNHVLSSPIALFTIAATFLGFLLFTDTHSTRYRAIAGTLHAATHLTTAIAVGWMATVLTSGRLAYGSSLQLLAAAAIVVLLGWIAGSVIVGIYLLISINGFGRHYTEAFSSLRIPDWKNFLRIVVRKNGTLSIFPIGITRVPRRWTETHADEYSAQFEPNDARATAPHLIEGPIEL
jgi:hypothetical protein